MSAFHPKWTLGRQLQPSLEPRPLHPSIAFVLLPNIRVVEEMINCVVGVIWGCFSIQPSECFKAKVLNRLPINLRLLLGHEYGAQVRS